MTLRLRRCERRTGPSLTCAKAWTGIRDTPPVFSRTFAEAASAGQASERASASGERPPEWISQI